MKNFVITFNVNRDEYYTTVKIFSVESVVQVDKLSAMVNGKIRIECEEAIESIEEFEEG